jgi:hypothetical protein
MAVATVTQGVAAASPQQPLTEFTLFPKLAIELRLKIFKHSLPISPNGIRMLKVAIDTLTLVSNSKTVVEITSDAKRHKKETKSERSSSVTFQLLDHQSNVYIQDFGLLGACSEYV